VACVRSTRRTQTPCPTTTRTNHHESLSRPTGRPLYGDDDLASVIGKGPLRDTVPMRVS